MNISPYFRNLRSAYFAELDDLTFDSEGIRILDKRLAQRRKEMEFLVHMLELSPEMVAVVFHKGFRFTSLAAMDDVLSRDSDALPEWDSLAHAIDMAPWTQPLVQQLHKQPQGEWFLTVAAALEYMYSKPEHAQAAQGEEEDNDDEQDGDGDHDDVEDADEKEARIREEAGADWMVEQGFDRKE
ncbi:MAG: hypothetical protein V4858_11260 [Pseudomonadota bacterium]